MHLISASFNYLKLNENIAYMFTDKLSQPMKYSNSIC